jgi:hypothetical protein
LITSICNRDALIQNVSFSSSAVVTHSSRWQRSYSPWHCALPWFAGNECFCFSHHIRPCGWRRSSQQIP